MSSPPRRRIHMRLANYLVKAVCRTSVWSFAATAAHGFSFEHRPIRQNHRIAESLNSGSIVRKIELRDTEDEGRTVVVRKQSG